MKLSEKGRRAFAGLMADPNVPVVEGRLIGHVRPIAADEAGACSHGADAPASFVQPAQNSAHQWQYPHHFMCATNDDEITATKKKHADLYHYDTGTGRHYAIYTDRSAKANDTSFTSYYGDIVPEYKPTFSWACCCHHTTNVVVLVFVGAFLAFAGYICYYVLNNG